MNALNTAITNDYRQTDADAVIDALGSDAAKGGDSLPKLALRCVQWAQDGVKSAADAHYIYNRYTLARTGSETFKGSKDSLKAQVSKLANFLNAGANTNTLAMPIFERGVELLAELPAEETKSTYTALVDLARAVKTATSPLSDEEITAVLLVKEAKAATEETKLKAAAKALEAAMKLRDEAGGAERYEVSAALRSVNEALAILDAEAKALAYQARQRLAA